MGIIHAGGFFMHGCDSLRRNASIHAQNEEKGEVGRVENGKSARIEADRGDGSGYL